MKNILEGIKRVVTKRATPKLYFGFFKWEKSTIAGRSIRWGIHYSLEDFKYQASVDVMKTCPSRNLCEADITIDLYTIVELENLIGEIKPFIVLEK